MKEGIYDALEALARGVLDLEKAATALDHPEDQVFWLGACAFVSESLRPLFGPMREGKEECVAAVEARVGSWLGAVGSDPALLEREHEVYRKLLAERTGVFRGFVEGGRDDGAEADDTEPGGTESGGLNFDDDGAGEPTPGRGGRGTGRSKPSRGPKK